MINLTDWKQEYVNNSIKNQSEETVSKDNFGKQFLRHLLIGVDYLPTENFYVALGYSYKRRTQFDGGGGGFFTGFSAGAGIKIRMFDVNASIAQLHRSGPTFMIGINMLLNNR